jgi:hypothetical protein
MSGTAMGAAVRDRIPDPALADLIDRAYEVFKIRPPGDLAVEKPYGIPEQTEARMLAHGQRDISLDDLRIWHHPHFVPDGAQDAVRWTLPRNLEFLAAGAWVGDFENSLALRRLRDTGYPEAYGHQERDVLNTFALLLAKAVLRAPDFYRDAIFSIDDLLRLFALGGIGITPILAILDARPTEDLIGHLHIFGEPVEIGTDPFWEDCSGYRDAIAWWASDRLEERMLTTALDERTAPDLARRAGEIADVIARLRPQLIASPEN